MKSQFNYCRASSKVQFQFDAIISDKNVFVELQFMRSLCIYSFLSFSYILSIGFLVHFKMIFFYLKMWSILHEFLVHCTVFLSKFLTNNSVERISVRTFVNIKCNESILNEILFLCVSFDELSEINLYNYRRNSTIMFVLYMWRIQLLKRRYTKWKSD